MEEQLKNKNENSGNKSINKSRLAMIGLAIFKAVS